MAFFSINKCNSSCWYLKSYLDSQDETWQRLRCRDRDCVPLLPSSIYIPIKNGVAMAIIGSLHTEEGRILTFSIRIPFHTKFLPFSNECSFILPRTTANPFAKQGVGRRLMRVKVSIKVNILAILGTSIYSQTSDFQGVVNRFLWALLYK